MFRKCILIHLVLTLLLVSRTTLAQKKAINFDELEATVNEELKVTNTPGAAMVVIVGDQVVFAKGFGVSSVETRSPVTPDTLFRIASTTKMLTAAALVALAEQGKIKLDEPIDKYVRGLSPRLSQVTVHQLLTHTAGLRDSASYYGSHDDSALAAFVHSWTDDYLIGNPGEVYSYSNIGYGLAAFVLETVTGKPFADAINEILFQPLGMRRTTLRPTEAMTYPLSQGHEVLSGQTKPSVVRPFADDSRYWANGGVFTSAADFARFAIAFLNSGKIEGRQVLPSTAITKLSTPYVEIPGGNQSERPRYAYGLNIRDYRGVRVLQHGGLRIGFGSLVRIVPEYRFAVIVLTNKSDSLLLKSMEKATELAVPLQPRVAASPKQPMTMSAGEMKRYVGVYQNAPDYLRLELVIVDGKLFLRQPEASEKSEVAKVGDNIFSAGGQEFVLISETNGRMKYLHISGHALRRM
jgi:CubicO group peptidase (beta-lactamase class C family)